MINEMCLCDVPADNRQAFLDRFRDHAARIMRDRGFRIQAMWTDAAGGRLRFVYLLAWIDRAERDAAWAAFDADLEWQGILARTAAEHGPLVQSTEAIVLAPVPFSRGIGEVG